MKLRQQFCKFIVFSNIFISICATLLTAETLVFWNFPPWLYWYAAFVFSGTLFIYTLHYFLKKELPLNDERQIWRNRNKSLFKAIIIISLGGIFLTCIRLYQLFHSSSPETGAFGLITLAILGLLSVAYSHPSMLLKGHSVRKFGKVKLLYLSLIWTVTTGLVPFLAFNQGSIIQVNALQLSIFIIHRLIFIASIAFLFNIYDYIEDKETGTRTFAVYFGQKKSIQFGKWLFLVLNFITSAVFIFAFKGTTIYITLAVILPVVSVFILYQKFNPAETESSFVLRHDGLMIIKALLLIFATVISKN